MHDSVEGQLVRIRGQAPILSSAPSAPAPGLSASHLAHSNELYQVPILPSAPPALGLPARNLAQSNDPFLTPPQPGTAYQYTAEQLYQQTGDGIRVRGSSPNMEVYERVDEIPSEVQQQLAAAKAKFAAIRQQKMLADQQLLDWQHQADRAAAQAKAQSDLQHYQHQIQEAEAQLQQTQQAFHRLQVSSTQQQPHLSVSQAQRQSVLRQSAHGQEYVTTIRETLQPAVSAFEIVVGTDGRRYKVPKSQMAQVPDFDIVTGSDGQQYKVARSQLSQVCGPQQHQQVHSMPSQVSPEYPWQPSVAQAGQVRTAPSVFSQQQLVTQPQYHSTAGPAVILPQVHSVPGAGVGVTAQHGGGDLEKLRGIVNLSDNDVARKPIKVIDYAKKCPAKWCKQLKPTTMNLPVFGYGATSELIDSLSGRTDQIPENVLLAKLRHLRDVFEVCCINSKESEFCDYGWTLARDYALKVQEKVEQQHHSWANHTGIQTDVLLSAQMEFPRPAKTKEDPKKVGDKPLCTTYNKCTTDGKCDYEVSSGRACLRKHECSWCRKNKNQGHKHQESKCPSKSAGGK